MTIYSTGNPIGSIDPRDLLDNAQNLDEAMNTGNPTFQDRFGNERVSWAGAIKVGIISETYGAGIEVTARNQGILSGGDVWVPAAGTALPYTTTGSGMPEGGAFELYQTLRQELVNPVATYDNVAAMIADSQLTVGRKARTLGYYTPGDGGGNDYEIVAAGTGTDDGGSYIDLFGSGLQAKGLFPTDTLTLKQFGVVGDGVADDTFGINAALARSSGLTVSSGKNQTYRITGTVTFSEGIRFSSNGCVFVKTSAGPEWAVRVMSGVYADRIFVESSGGEGDNGIRVQGSGVTIDSASYVSEMDNSATGVRVQSVNGQPLHNVKINSIYVENCLSGILVYNVQDSNFSNFTIKNYRTGLYLRDVSRSSFRDGYMYLANPNATGGAGQNGILVESTLSASSSNNINFSRISIANAPEHAIRFGGSLAITDIWLNKIRTAFSGGAGASATGGAGIKILGIYPTGELHKRFYISDCQIADCSTTGSGVGNFAGIQLAGCNDIYINNCEVIPKNNPYSAWHGVSISGCVGVEINNLKVKKARRHAVRYYRDFESSPLIINRDIVLSGCFLEIDSPERQVLYFDGGSAIYQNCSVYSSTLKGGYTAIRSIVPSGDGDYLDNYFGFTYLDPQDTSGPPPFHTMNEGFLLNVRSINYGTFGASGQDGSIWQDSGSGAVRIRKGGAWVDL